MTDCEWGVKRFQALSCSSLSGVCIDQDWCETDSLIFHTHCLVSFYFSPVRLLPNKLSVSVLHTQELSSSHCIYNPVAPSRPRPRCDWLADAAEPARYATLPILFTFPSGNGSVTAKRIWARTYGQIIRTYTNMQAGTHTHSRDPGKVWCLYKRLGFPFSLFSCCPLDAAAQKIVNIWFFHLYLIICVILWTSKSTNGFNAPGCVGYRRAWPK